MNPKEYRFIWPKITQDTKDAVMKQLDIGEISIYDNSGIFQTFEDKFKAYIGTNYALTFSSGTAAIHASIVSCGISYGDEVLCPAYTFFATVSPIFQTGAVPVLIDSDNTGNIDPLLLRKSITSKTKAIMITHMWGYPADMDAICAICNEFNLKLIEDCSHAHGAEYKGRKVGSFGDMSAFSLQGQKIITGGEGGIITTNNKSLYERALLFGHYNKRCKKEIQSDSILYPYAVTGMGLKLRAHPFAISMANEQLGHLSEWIILKNKNAQYLQKRLEEKIGDLIYCNNTFDNIVPSFYAITVTIKKDINMETLQEIVKEIQNRGVYDIDAPNSTCPLNMLRLFQNPEIIYPEYANKINYRIGDFPVAERYFNTTFKLPIDVVDTEEYRYVLDFYVDIISSVLRNKFL